MSTPYPSNFADSVRHGAGTELFLVEGESAARALLAVRDAASQAVLPLMGKPLNAVKAPLAKVTSYPLFVALVDALGAGAGAAFALDLVRFERIILLMDADADGIHCSALMCLYFHRMMRPLLAASRVAVTHAPMATLTSHALGRQAHIFTEVDYRATATAWRAEGASDLAVSRYRGLASLDHETLATSCVDRATRTLRGLGLADAEAALAVFGGAAPDLFVSPQRPLEF